MLGQLTTCIEYCEYCIILLDWVINETLAINPMSIEILNSVANHKVEGNKVFNNFDEPFGDITKSFLKNYILKLN